MKSLTYKGVQLFYKKERRAKKSVFIEKEIKVLPHQKFIIKFRLYPKFALVEMSSDEKVAESNSWRRSSSDQTVSEVIGRD